MIRWVNTSGTQLFSWQVAGVTLRSASDLRHIPRRVIQPFLFALLQFRGHPSPWVLFSYRRAHAEYFINKKLVPDTEKFWYWITGESIYLIVKDLRLTK